MVVLNSLFLLASLCSVERQAPPRLVVLVVIDQMRADYLDRFSPVLTDGLRRVRDESIRFTRAFHEHAVTATSPGHATLITGCNPARNGMIANQIPASTPGKFKLAAVDDQTKLVGGEGTGSSSRDLLVPALGDWMKAKNKESRVVALGLKNRSAALLGGQHPDICCFLDDKSGRYVTSTWYASTLPPFVARFNDERPPEAEFGKSWTPILDDAQFDAVGATADAMAYEGRYGLATTKDTTFPHVVRSPADFTFFPLGDERTLELALRAIDAMDLGKDDAPDLLCVGLSASDYIGHAYGPESRELADYYARLDGTLGRFLREVESRREKGAVLFAFSADHGVSPVVEHLVQQGLDAGRLQIAKVTRAIDDSLDREFGASNWVDGVLPDVYLNRAAITNSGHRASEIEEAAARVVRTLPGIEDAWTRDQMTRAVPVAPDPFRRSFNADRSGDVVLAFKPNWQLDYLDTVGYVKTNHSTHHEYDQHIPMLFLRSGMARATRTERFSSVDLAPTIAQLLHVPPTCPVDGAAHELEPASTQ